MDLSDNQLDGPIPTELGDLASLENLDLSSNGLYGRIPSQLANLSNLKRIDLVKNRLVGSVPPELFNLSNLISLNVDEDELKHNFRKALKQLEETVQTLSPPSSSIPTKKQSSPLESFAPSKELSSSSTTPSEAQSSSSKKSGCLWLLLGFLGLSILFSLLGQMN